MRNSSFKFCLSLLVLFSIAAPLAAQRNRKPIIFAVLDNGKSLEPIAFVVDGKLTAPVGGDADKTEITSFAKNYYKSKSSYRLIFGGVSAGSASVLSSNEKAECAPNTANVSVSSPKTKFSGFVMALATDAATKKAASGLRRKPTAAEKSEIDALVKKEFANQKVPAAALKVLNYQNLTALDVDNDKKPDFVGSYWVNTNKTERALLFFIAQKDAKGKYQLGFSEFRKIKQDETMSKDIKSVDEGVYHEVLLDAFDYNNDGISEIFTYTPSFEGAGFNAYELENGSWKRAFEGANYHCGY